MLLLVSAGMAQAQSAAEPRTWTNLEGKTIQATFVQTTGTEVSIRMENGQVAKVPLSTLSAVDQEYVKLLAAASSTPSMGSSSTASAVNSSSNGWPTEAIKVDPKSLVVTPGLQSEAERRYHYATDSFEYIAFAPLAGSVINDVAADFELTKVGLARLPWGWKPHPEKTERYQIYLTETNDDYIRMGGDDRSSAATKDGKTFIRFSAIGLKKLGARYAFDLRQKDTERIISMTIRELMWEERLLMVPALHIGMEGFMRYIAYQNNGTLKFTDLESNLKKQVKVLVSYGVLPSGERMLRALREGWQERRTNADKLIYENQLDGLMLFYFFGYLDGDKSGAGLHEYFRTVVSETALRDAKRGTDTPRSKELIEKLVRERDDTQLLEELTKAFAPLGIKL